jgi:hypothetical protein
MKLTNSQLRQIIKEAAAEYVWGVKAPGRVANQYRLSVLALKGLISEEIQKVLQENGGSLTSGADIQPGTFPEVDWRETGSKIYDRILPTDSIEDIRAGRLPGPESLVRDLTKVPRVAGPMGVAAGIAAENIIDEFLPEDRESITWDDAYDAINWRPWSGTGLRDRGPTIPDIVRVVGRGIADAHQDPLRSTTPGPAYGQPGRSPALEEHKGLYQKSPITDIIIEEINKLFEQPDVAPPLHRPNVTPAGAKMDPSIDAGDLEDLERKTKEWQEQDDELAAEAEMIGVPMADPYIIGDFEGLSDALIQMIMDVAADRYKEENQPPPRG